MPLRPELIRFPLPDGGIELLDLVLERSHVLSPDEAAALDAPGPELRAKLEAALLVDGPAAAALREGARHARVRSRMPAPAGTAEGAWDQARELPPLVAAAWRDPERWRRLAEDRIAGRALLRLDGFVAQEVARELVRRVDGLAFGPRHGAYVQGEGCEVTTELDDLIAVFRAGPLHALLGHVMGQALPARMFLRAWRLGPGDLIAAHRDGIHYVTTFSIGLSEGWSTAHGGAIAFGHPTAGGLAITERWLPHLGDLLVFEPTALAWHLVEPVARGTRYTLTGHYVSPSYPG